MIKNKLLLCFLYTFTLLINAEYSSIPGELIAIKLKKSTENIFEKTLLEIRKNIVNTYSSVLLAGENIQFLEKNKENLSKNLKELTQLFDPPLYGRDLKMSLALGKPLK